MKVLIVGLGSIARKHIVVLHKIKKNLQIFALRSNKNNDTPQNVVTIYKWEDIPSDIDFIIISNPTNKHYETIEYALNLKVPLFIEKPVLKDTKNYTKLLKIIKKSNIKTYVAYNMRFHPVITWLKKFIEGKQIYEISAYCGSFLPEWKPNNDYRKNYSASEKMGGGVHLDLIHELDYINFLFGKPNKISVFLSKKSKLQINSIDCAHYWLEYPSFNVSILLNYYRRDSKRKIELVCENNTYTANLLNNTVIDANNNIIFSYPIDPMYTYEKQMNYFLEHIKDSEDYNNTFEESIETLKLALHEK